MEKREEHHHLEKDEHEMTYYEKRLLALIRVLRDKGVIRYEEELKALKEIEAETPAQGARVVAKAWKDPAYKQRLLANGKAAVDELGISTRLIKELRVVENTESVHNVIVCTLCSCYPNALLGQPPDWYKNVAYRTRVVIEPRGVLEELGFEPAGSKAIKVWDSAADVRYLVLPRRPRGAEGWPEEELAKLVTRDSMIGVGEPLPPKG